MQLTNVMTMFKFVNLLPARWQCGAVFGLIWLSTSPRRSEVTIKSRPHSEKLIFVAR